MSCGWSSSVASHHAEYDYCWGCENHQQWLHGYTKITADICSNLLLDLTPIQSLGSFCNCERALKSSCRPAVRPAHAWCSLDTVWNRGWPVMTDGHWDTRDLCGSHFPPADSVCSDSNEPPIKRGGRWRRWRRGKAHVKRMMGRRYSARQPVYDSLWGISQISHQTQAVWMWDPVRGGGISCIQTADIPRVLTIVSC